MAESNIEILKQSKLFQGIDGESLEFLCSYIDLSGKKYDKNQIVINQGDSVRHVGIIKNGTVISSKNHMNGDSQIFRIYRQKEVFLLDAVSTTFLTSPVTLTSQTVCEILWVPFLKILEEPLIDANTKNTMLANSSEILGNELIRLMYKIDVLSKRTLQERILTYLSLISEKEGKRTFDIGMTQEEFAQYLCVNRSVLSKELNLLRKEGKIGYKKSHFTLF